MKKKISFLVVLSIAIIGYFLLFYKDKKLQYIPNNADLVVLIDVKNVSRNYLGNYILHPSEWFKNKEEKQDKITIRNSGIIVPDFFQIFHLKNTVISQWFTILEVKEKQQFIKFLKQEKFIEIAENAFVKDKNYVKILQGKCILGIGNFKNNEAFLSQIKSLESFKNFKQISANQLIDSSHGSISYFKGNEVYQFSLEINKNNIEIKNVDSNEDLEAFEKTLKEQNFTLNFEIGKEEIAVFNYLDQNKLADSSSIFSAKGKVNVEEVKDKVVTYEYDENFNEIEKVAYQKILQPNYYLSLKSNDAKKTWSYFAQKKWINSQNQFTAIPFQPNLIAIENQETIIKSMKKSQKKYKFLNKNYIFFKNNSLLFSSFKSLSNKEKEILSDLDFIFYERQKESVYFKINFKEKNLPLILRY